MRQCCSGSSVGSSKYTLDKNLIKFYQGEYLDLREMNLPETEINSKSVRSDKIKEH